MAKKSIVIIQFRLWHPENRTAVPIEEYIEMEETVIQECLERLPQVLTSMETVVHADFLECHRNLTQEHLQSTGGSMHPSFGFYNNERKC